MSTPVNIASDLVAIVVLAYAVYFRRHQRRDMLLAYIGLNIGVMAVAIALDRGTPGAGLGLGLFGVLSIVRLRSSELTQEEVAYYFVSLAMGLLGGLRIDPTWVGPALMATMVAALYVADHPKLFRRHRHQMLTLDVAYTDERRLKSKLETMLGAEVKQMIVRKLDFVQDTTIVDVRYRLLEPAPSAGAYDVFEQGLGSAGAGR